MTDNRKKREPERKCIGCESMRPKSGLMRIILGPSGTAVPDETKKQSGRGAYICFNSSCAQKARKRKSLERTFKTRIDPVSYEILAEAVVRYEAG